MVKRIVGWFVLVPLCVVLIVVALANRQLVVVNFNPFMSAQELTAPGFGVPLFLVIFAVLLVGVLLGGIATWFRQGKWRKTARVQRREADEWHTRADRLEKELEDIEPSSHPRLPAK